MPFSAALLSCSTSLLQQLPQLSAETAERSHMLPAGFAALLLGLLMGLPLMPLMDAAAAGDVGALLRPNNPDTARPAGTDLLGLTRGPAAAAVLASPPGLPAPAPQGRSSYSTALNSPSLSPLPGLLLLLPCPAAAAAAGEPALAPAGDIQGDSCFWACALLLLRPM